MQVKVIDTGFYIHNTPLEQVQLEGAKIVVNVDDTDEQRWRLVFSPYQALRVTTIDCIDIAPFLINDKKSNQVLEVIDSDWINLLRITLKNTDSSASFLDKSKHYIIPLQDNVIEIISWDLYIAGKI
ncbi:hypothetical protein [Cohnella fermenti]|uniref:Uncharacterized protein n=1 Tax=Cohnella fermenti TaxID=2565925 RepID=A0A4S4C4R9_9BACL|nr:hypothetical protein [Cohnella fermenti]THF82729.1 hypothetical protein E6C55_06615 [Cohnella fermenti]